MSIIIAGLSKSFGKAEALQEINLTVGEGEFVSLLGPSGCGKTTTLRCVAGFATPTTGTIHIGGRDVTHLPPQRREVGMVFQHYELFPHLTIKENVAFGLRERRWPEGAIQAKVAEMLQLVQLPETLHRYPHQLSGGQQQRVALARALAPAPKVLLMDEPLGALDLKLRESMQMEIRRIQQSMSISTIYVTHDQGEALTMSDRVAVMNEGRICQVGTPQEIYGDPLDRFAAEFVGQMNFIEGTVVDSTAVQCQPRLTVRIPAIAPGHRGKAVVLGIRPEHLRLTPATGSPESASYAWPGRVQQQKYSGNLLHFFVQLEDGPCLMVEQGWRPDLPGPGAQVAVAYTPRHIAIWQKAGARLRPEAPPPGAMGPTPI